MARKKSVILQAQEDESKQAEIKRLKSQISDLAREAEERRLAIGHQSKELTNVLVNLQQAQSKLNILTNRGDLPP